MSYELISRSEDLKRLKDDGYVMKLFDGYLTISHIPYVDENRRIKYGILASKLELDANHTVKPTNHMVLWAGNLPCDSEGAQLPLGHSPEQALIRDELMSSYSFSQKPEDGYNDYHHKMTAYIRLLENEARVLEPNVTALVGQDETLSDENSVFHYADTASSRAGITAISRKLREGRIAIIGLGGTGAYVLDHVAKTHVEEIHLFDDDQFLQHNVFRFPGVPSLDKPVMATKVELLAETYLQLRKGIIPHLQRIDKSNTSELDSMTFVFLCVDNDESRRLIIDHLTKNEIPFIDTGIGLYNKNNVLGGLVRITTCTPSFHDHVTARCLHGNGQDNVYSTNIQISEMNALAAAYAVIKWKKACKFYYDFGHEHHTVYGIDTNTTTNEELADEVKDN